MAATNDTIDGLLAEFRGYSAGMPASYHVTMSWADFRKMLTRFEAAHRREKCDCAKLREAVIGLRDRISMFYKNEWIPYDEWEGANDDANAALAAPPRNCDVGTPKEQHERYNCFCYAHRSHENGCGRCPLNGEPCCELAWAQMPYKEGGAK